uniref:Retinol dehydrogenase 1 n=1 Tax=Sinocyclocheilus grahami TaxID=75366 RepID=A0A672MUD8_SINGR
MELFSFVHHHRTRSMFIQHSFTRLHPRKHVLVTGCDSGFGHLAARQLDRQGVHGASRLRASASPRLKTLLLNVTDSVSAARPGREVRRTLTLNHFDISLSKSFKPCPYFNFFEICIFTSMSNNVSKIILFSLADIRRDMMHFGVNGSITEPGFFKTQVTDLSLTEDDLKKWWSNLPTEVRRAYGDSYLFGYHDAFKGIVHANMLIL